MSTKELTQCAGTNDTTDTEDSTDTADTEDSADTEDTADTADTSNTMDATELWVYAHCHIFDVTIWNAIAMNWWYVVLVLITTIDVYSQNSTQDRCIFYSYYPDHWPVSFFSGLTRATDIHVILRSPWH